MGMNGGRRAVPVGQELAHAIGDFLAGVCECEAIEVHGVHRLRGGAVQENYAIDVELRGGRDPGRHRLVLRTAAPTGVSTSLSRAAEFAVLGVAREAGVRVPEPLWLCDDPGVIGRAFFVMRWLPGVTAGHRLVRDALLDASRQALVESLGEELARLHAVRPPHPRLDFLLRPDHVPALRRVSEYRRYLDELPDPQPVIEWGLRWLERHAEPLRREVVLCHGDYRTGNYAVDGGELAGILDWEFAGWSDPLEDIAWFCARCWRFGRWDREAGGMADREAFYRGYERVSGAAIERELVPYWEVMAAVRWVVLALQQGQRHLSGEESSLELALTGRMVPEMELDILQQLEAIRAGTT